jgi:hypothetical protein
MAKKIWTLQTLIEQLRYKVNEVYEEDILDPGAAALDMTLRDVLDELKEAEFSKGFEQLPGQQALQVDAPDQPAYVGTTGDKQLRDQEAEASVSNTDDEDD